MAIRSLFAAIIFLAFSFTPIARSQATQPVAVAPLRVATIADLRAMHDAGAYQICLHQLGRVIQLRGDLAKGYDRGELYLLRGDCLLHLQDSDEAVRAYRLALNSPTLAHAQEARATLELIHRCRNLAYLPKTRQVAEPIPITDESRRKVAIKDLFADEMDEYADAIKSAERGDSLLPIIELAETLLTLQSLEVVATGKDEQIGPILTNIGEHARTLIEREMKLQDDKISVIEAKANQLLSNNGSFWWQNETSRRGLYTADRKQLRDVIAYVEKVESAAKLGQQYAWKLGRKGEKWEPILSDCYSLIQHASRVLDAG